MSERGWIHRKSGFAGVPLMPLDIVVGNPTLYCLCFYLDAASGKDMTGFLWTSYLIWGPSGLQPTGIRTFLPFNQVDH